MQKASKQEEVEPVEASLLSVVGHPRATIEDNGQNTSLIDADLGPFTQQAVVSHSLNEFGHEPCSLSNSRADIGVKRC